MKTKSLLLAFVLLTMPTTTTPVDGQNPCNGFLSSQTTGGSTSMCPSPLKETWNKTISGNMTCNNPGVAGVQSASVTTNNTLTLEATGTCSGNSIQCGYQDPIASNTIDDSGGTHTFTWANGVFVNNGCQAGEQSAFRYFDPMGTCTSGFCCGGQAECEGNSGSFWIESGCECRMTPLLVSFGAGWNGTLTAAESGAPFKLYPAGQTVLVAWPRNAQQVAGWLIRDRDHNGLIDDASELYGGATPQFAVGGKRHGFAALATEDSNGDGIVSSSDASYAEMGIWFDRDHNGKNDAGEIQSLAALGISRLHIEYTTLTNATDSGGNIFMFEGSGVRQVGKTLQTIRLYDVLVRTSRLTIAIQ